MNRKIGKLFSTIFLLASANTFATSYNMPPPEKSLIGGVQYITANQGDTVVSVAKRYDIGYNAMEGANSHLNMNQAFVAGAPLQIPTKHLLPQQRVGIVVNLPEMRMYYYPAGTNKVLTYPIGIGKIGKTIPITQTSITRKAENPTWVPPDDIREFNLDQGIILPKVMPPGPDNPLGPYAIYMKVPTYLIHSTIFPESVGKRASFGCIRMYESDIKEFFPSVNGGIPVAIVNEPIKFGWQDNSLYMEAYKSMEEHSDDYNATLAGAVHNIAESTKDEPTLVDWQLVSYLVKERDGIPHNVGMRLPR